ncbi:hypothetical protein IAT38_007576 [Cryptococcus sp. DSM 104549]
MTQSPASSSSVLHRTLAHEPIFVDHAQGNYLYTESGQKILDACGGAAVISIGHGREDVTNALYDQLQRVSYVHSGAWATRPAEELAQILVEGSGMARAVFYSSGSEAMEAAIKLARQYHVENKQPQRINFIAREQSYHGNTLGGLGVGRHHHRREPYLSLFSPTFHAVSPCYPYRYKSSGETDEKYVQRLAGELEAKILELGADTVAAFIAETVVGATSGCTPAVPGYFQAMRDVCDKYGVLIVLDEIMCGMGRTGKLHAWEHWGVQPDIQACGKALSGGYAPVSAVLANQKVIDVMEKGSGAFNNGHTYQSSSLGCRAGVEVQKVMQKEGLVERCRVQGEKLESKLREAFETHQHVGDIRGQGLFWSIELVQDKGSVDPFPASLPLSNKIVDECVANGVVLYPGKGTADGVVGDHVLIAPPYTVTDEELDLIVEVLKCAVNKTIEHL